MRVITTTPTAQTTYRCPTVAPGEDPYTLTTTHSGSTATRMCTRTTTTPTIVTYSCADGHTLTTTTDGTDTTRACERDQDETDTT